MNVLLIAATVLFQQRAPIVPQSTDTSPVGVSRQAITDLSLRVAEVRSGDDQLRREVFNGTGASVMDRGRLQQQRCADLAAAARATTARVCRACFPPNVQRAMNQYRAALPSVVRTGTRCAAALARDLRADPSGSAVRQHRPTLARTIQQGLLPYENAIHAVRLALGLEVPVSVLRGQPPAAAQTPRRPGT